MDQSGQDPQISPSQSFPRNPVANMVNELPTDPLQPSQATHLPSSNLPLLQQAHPCNTVNWNDFDWEFLAIEQQDANMQNTEMDGLLSNLSRAIPRPYLNSEQTMLQKYLIQQQRCAGILPEQIEPMAGPGSKQMRPPIRGSQPGYRPPVMVDVSNNGVFAMDVPPARFNGFLAPLPDHFWFTDPEAFARADVMRTANAMKVANGTVGINTPNSQSQPTINESGCERKAACSATLTNGAQVAGSYVNPGPQHPTVDIDSTSVSNAASAITTGNQFPLTDGLQFNAGTDHFSCNNLAELSNHPQYYATPPVSNDSLTILNSPIYQSSSTQPMTSDNAVNEIQSLDQQLPLANGTDVNYGYDLFMPNIPQINQFQVPGCINYIDNPSFLANDLPFSGGDVFSGATQPMANSTSVNPFQGVSTNTQAMDGSFFFNVPMLSLGPCEHIMDGEQISEIHNTGLWSDTNLQFPEQTHAQPMPDSLCHSPLNPRPTGLPPPDSVTEDLAQFFNNEEEQRIITDFYINHFSNHT